MSFLRAARLARSSAYLRYPAHAGPSTLSIFIATTRTSTPYVQLVATSSRSYWWSSAPKPPVQPSPLPSEPPTVSVEPSASTPTESALPPPELYKPDSVLSSTSPEVVSTPIPDGSIADLVTTPLANGDHIGDLASLGLGGWSPAGIVQTLLEQIHVTTGLPWWATIITLVAVVRIASLPIHLRVVANNSRMAYCTKRVQECAAEIKEARQNQDQLALMKAAGQMRQAYADVGASPLTGLMGIIQLPIGLAMFFGLKWMCNLPLESMKTGGLWWLPDLTVSDPTFILPVLGTGAFMAMLRLQQAETPRSNETKHMTNGFTIMSIMGLPFMMQLPSGVTLYFIANGALLGVQAAILRIPAIKKAVGILPPPPTSMVVPAPSMFETVQAGFNKFKTFNEDTFEKIAKNAAEKARRDMIKREEEMRRSARIAAGARHASTMSRGRSGRRSK